MPAIDLYIVGANEFGVINAGSSSNLFNGDANLRFELLCKPQQICKKYSEGHNHWHTWYKIKFHVRNTVKLWYLT